MQTATKAMDDLARHPKWRAFRKAFTHDPNSVLAPEGQALIAFETKLANDAKAAASAAEKEKRRKVRELQELKRRWLERDARLKAEAMTGSNYRTTSLPHEVKRRREAAAALARANKPRPRRTVVQGKARY